MTITKTTPDADLLAPVAAARQRLAEAAVAENVLAEHLAAYVHEVAREEGRAFVRGLVRDALIEEISGEQVRNRLLRLLARGADDEWSGRKNDGRRARFDGIRAEVNDLVTGGLSDYGW